MRNYGFKKTTLRNDFTAIFGGVGKRRVIFVNPKGKANPFKRTRMQMHRRAAQGWRNKAFGRLTALKMLIKYGFKSRVRRFRL
jgi:hypothetical protein